MEAMCLSSLPPPLLNQPPQFEEMGVSLVSGRTASPWKSLPAVI